MANLTEEEKILVIMFRRKIQDLPILDEEDRTDKHLIRWLRARDLDVSKAEEMVRKSVQWRTDCNIDDSLYEFRPPAVYRQLFRMTVTGLDPEGCPVVIAPFWDIRPVVNQRDRFVRFVDKIIYTIGQDSKARGVTQFIFVADLQEFAWKHLQSRAAISILLQLVKTFEDNYPEALKSATVVNAPKIFTILFNLIKPLLTARTLAKVQICGQNPEKWKPVLLEKVPADKLPVKYGGVLEEVDITNNVVRDFYSGSDSGLMDDFQGQLMDYEDSEEEGMNAIQIGPGEKFDVELAAKTRGQILRWNFSCDNNDIGFIVHYKPAGLEAVEDLGNVLVGYSRKTACEGSVEVPAAGICKLTFDNTFSRFKTKNLKYSAQILAPDQLS